MTAREQREAEDEAVRRARKDADAAIMARPRPMTGGTYLVGLPVVVTIGDDGEVTLAVCPEEAAVAVAEEDGTADHIAAVEAALATRTYRVTTT